jgi:hypothetical protein
MRKEERRNYHYSLRYNPEDRGSQLGFLFSEANKSRNTKFSPWSIQQTVRQGSVLWHLLTADIGLWLCNASWVAALLMTWQLNFK